MLLIPLLLSVYSGISAALPMREDSGEIPDGQVDSSALTLLIILVVSMGVLVIGALSLLVYASVMLFLRMRSVKLENSVPGSFDDDFEIEERLSELSPNEQNLYHTGQDFIKQFPPYNDELSLSNHLMIQEKGIEAWDFIPDFNLPNDSIYINNKTEINFLSYDYQCSIQSNLPIPKINDVYYFEAKIFSLESAEDTIVSMGLATKPYPYFRLPGRHLYSVAYDSTGSRRVNNSFRLTDSEKNIFPELEQGDVVGVGYRVRSGTIFFTRNGKKLSEKAVGGHVKGMRMNNLFPTIGANNPCSVHVNLGQYGYVYIEANIKKWGYAQKEGTRPPLPDYNTSRQDLLLESSNENNDEDDEIIDPPDFYENAAYQSSNHSFQTQDNITLNTLPPDEPPKYVLEDEYGEEEEEGEADDESTGDILLRNTMGNQFLGDDLEGYEARNSANDTERDESPLD